MGHRHRRCAEGVSVKHEAGVDMTKAKSAGYFRSGLPYNRFGHGPGVAVVFQGLVFENKPLSGFSARYNYNMYRFLERDFATYIVTRRPGLRCGSNRMGKYCKFTCERAANA